jgi:hypothetical protein
MPLIILESTKNYEEALSKIRDFVDTFEKEFPDIELITVAETKDIRIFRATQNQIKHDSIGLLTVWLERLKVLDLADFSRAMELETLRQDQQEKFGSMISNSKFKN